jgi:nitroreductase
MQPLSAPISEIIRRRSSCRTFTEQPIAPELQARLAAFAGGLGAGPLGGRARFVLAAASENDRHSLRGLGTYGFIRGATGFVVGATTDGEEKLEDFGWLLEQLVLLLADLGLGACWLGGTFTKSSFAEKIAARPDELIPAVIATGYPAPSAGTMERLIRRGAGSDHRLAWERLFFEGGFATPLAQASAGAYALPLEMVRLAPSASNKQPWRVVRQGNNWHFYLQRTPNYREGRLNRMFTQADLQRVDIGIAMCHFEWTAREQGLAGAWVKADPRLPLSDPMTEYAVTWQAHTDRAATSDERR